MRTFIKQTKKKDTKIINLIQRSLLILETYFNCLFKIPFKYYLI